MHDPRTDPPKGYVVITEGKVRNTDFVFDNDRMSWRHPKLIDYEVLGSDVKFYYGVARKESEVKMPQLDVKPAHPLEFTMTIKVKTQVPSDADDAYVERIRDRIDTVIGEAVNKDAFLGGFVGVHTVTDDFKPSRRKIDD